MKTSNDLLELLIKIDSLKPKNFSGLGLVLYENIDNLPVASLKIIEPSIKLPIKDYESIIDFLLEISNEDSKYHDGFHFLNKNFELTHISQYIAPPIAKNYLGLESGSRYRTALYTSFLPQVIACGVLSNNSRPTVFVNGVEK